LAQANAQDLQLEVNQYRGNISIDVGLNHWNVFFPSFFTSDEHSIALKRETAFQATKMPESILKQGEKAITLYASTFFLATCSMTMYSGNSSSKLH